MHSSDVFKVHLKTIKHEKKTARKPLTGTSNIRYRLQTLNSIYLKPISMTQLSIKCPNYKKNLEMAMFHFINSFNF